MNSVLKRKVEKLEAYLKNLEFVAVAFSGGVDSSFLLATVQRAKPHSHVAVTGFSPSLSSHQFEQSKSVARELGSPHLVLKTSEMLDSRYTENPRNRCYFCKSALFDRIAEFLGRGSAVAFTVLDGNNADDVGDFRPGMAASHERGVLSPLIEFGFSKEEVREGSRELGLKTADYPASPCLSSRLPYGRSVTLERLMRIEAAEPPLREAGFSDFRVRDLEGETARVEVAGLELEKLLAEEDSLRSLLVSTGFKEVLFDKEPLRSGRLNGVT